MGPAGQAYDSTQRSIFKQTVSLTAMSPLAPDDTDGKEDYLRLRLLMALAGTDRGFAVNSMQAAEVAAAAEALVSAGGSVNLTNGAGASLSMCLLLPRHQVTGMWALLRRSGSPRSVHAGCGTGIRRSVPSRLTSVSRHCPPARRDNRRETPQSKCLRVRLFGSQAATARPAWSSWRACGGWCTPAASPAAAAPAARGRASP